MLFLEGMPSYVYLALMPAFAFSCLPLFIRTWRKPLVSRSNRNVFLWSMFFGAMLLASAVFVIWDEASFVG